MAADRRFAASHCFQVNTSQTLITAGQDEDRTVPHSVGDFDPASASEKMNSTTDAQVLCQPGEAIPVCSFANNFALQIGMRLVQSREARNTSCAPSLPAGSPQSGSSASRYGYHSARSIQDRFRYRRPRFCRRSRFGHPILKRRCTFSLTQITLRACE